MIPFPLAATRDEARDNAVHLIKQAEEHINTGGFDPGGLIALAQVWIDIARSFPESHSQLRASWDSRSAVEENHHPRPADDTQILTTQAVIKSSGVVTDGPVPIPVDSDHWDVLRYLAACYLVTQPEHQMGVDLKGVREHGETYNLHFMRMPDTTIMHVLYGHS